MMRHEFVIEETRMRAEVEKMDTAFCTALPGARLTRTKALSIS
jgi:hypothetical protein